MSRKVALSDQQTRWATRIVREKGLTCPDCGGSEPVPNDELLAHPDGGADVSMRCEECEGASEMALVLSPDEAKALGLHSRRELASTLTFSEGYAPGSVHSASELLPDRTGVMQGVDFGELPFHALG